MSDQEEPKSLSSDQEVTQSHTEPESENGQLAELETIVCENPSGQVHQTELSNSAHTDDAPSNESSDVLINGADLAPVGGEPESALDDDPVSELSQKFVDMLDLPMTKPELVRENAQSGIEPEPEMTPEDIKKFNDAMEEISAYAEDVVKTWFAQIYDRPLSDVFPDGLTNNVGSVTMLPNEDMIRDRRRTRVGHDEEVRDDDMHEDDTSGWELKLCVVDSKHRTNLDEWKLKDPLVLRQMLGLLNKAWGYIHYAIECYDLPNKDLFIDYDDDGKLVSKFRYSPWGTLYIPEAPETVPQIGIALTKIQPKPKSE